VALADARLSPRSARRFAKFRRWTQPLFDLLDWIAVADEKEMGRWRALGLEAGKLRITGSIKFDHETQPGTSMTASLREVLRAAGLDREFPLFVAGSTHSGEELLLCETLPALRKKSPGLRLVLVPRHVERAGSLLRELSHLNFKIAKRSEILVSAVASPAPEQAPDILLVDTTGELRDWYALATVIFVGKSLCGRGGQNPVEAVLAGKPVVFGPHMDNFQSVVEGLLRARGAVCVANARELESAVGDLLTDAGLRDLMSQNAINVIRPHQGASARTAQLVLDTPASISPP
jgi:3-deoxy-D-manno-octulosonic-acid transferase